MPNSLKFGYIRCYVAGKDYLKATESALQRLLEDGLHPDEVLQPILEMDSKDWSEHIKDQWPDYVHLLPTQEEFSRAMAAGSVVYGPIGSSS